MSSSINLASGLAPVAEISDSNDGQDASGLAPDAIKFVSLCCGGQTLCVCVPFSYSPQQQIILFNNGIDRFCQYYVICM